MQIAPQILHKFFKKSNIPPRKSSSCEPGPGLSEGWPPPIPPPIPHPDNASCTVAGDFCMQSLKKFKKVLVNKIFVVHLQTQTKHGSLGSLAQLVQSVCLTSRGSGVRLPQLPQNSKSGTCSLLQVPFRMSGGLTGIIDIFGW